MWGAVISASMLWTYETPTLPTLGLTTPAPLQKVGTKTQERARIPALLRELRQPLANKVALLNVWIHN